MTRRRPTSWWKTFEIITFVVLVLWPLLLSILIGHWFFKVEADNPDTETIICYWARYYGVDPDYLIHIARAESGLNQTALGKHGELGLMQIKAETWIWIREEMGLCPWTWLRLDVQESARTAAYAISIGLDEHWTTAGGYRTPEDCLKHR